MNDQLLIISAAAGAVGLLGYSLSRMVLGEKDDDKLRDRLTGKGAETSSSSPFVFGGQAAGKSRTAGFMELIQRVGQAAAEPFMPSSREKVSGLRQNLAKAGLYSPSAMRLLVGAKVIFLFVGLIGGYALGAAMDNVLLWLACGGLVGYLGPQFWLKTRIKTNQKALTYGLADALDLMVVCVESGLTVDAAMQRVGQEMGIAHPGLAREFGIAHMETRVGLSRGEALKNMGQRTGCPAIQSLVAMLVQADRFGTSIAQALRVHAETIRANRQFAAEEQAAKASVKISFPLVLFIFPSTFIVLCGPTIMELMNSALFN
jgi:tight adherence protein C